MAHGGAQIAFSPHPPHRRRRRASSDDAQRAQCTMLDDLRLIYDTRRKSPYQVANPAFYTNTALLKRESIQLEPVVRCVLMDLYEAVDEDGNGEIDQSEHAKLVERLYTCLQLFWDENMPALSEEEMQKMCEDDWQADSQGHANVDFNRFATSIFRLCDVWTDALNGEVYLAFLCRLRNRLTMAGFRKGKSGLKNIGSEVLKRTLLPEKHMLELKAANTGYIPAKSPIDRCACVLEMYNPYAARWTLNEELGAMLGKGQIVSNRLSNDPALVSRIVLGYLKEELGQFKKYWECTYRHCEGALNKHEIKMRRQSLDNQQGKIAQTPNGKQSKLIVEQLRWYGAHEWLGRLTSVRLDEWQQMQRDVQVIFLTMQFRT